MKNNIINLTLASAILLGYAGFASADDVPTQTLGATLSATDYFQVTCGTGTGRVFAQVKDNTAGSNVLGVLVHKSLAAKNSTDVTGADANYSPGITVTGTPGVFNVSVKKTTAAARSYNLRVHCETSAGVHLTTSYSLKQNQ